MIAKFLQRAVIASLLATAAIAPALADDDTVQPVYTYNDQGQIVLATYPDGAAIAYTYDANGNIATVVQVASPNS